tara:strand:+ start:7484 stop:8179 length:696 start_codon:yes stop_codon:yes gene_type:complete
MINLKIGKHKCQIPNEWHEMTISKYAKVVAILLQHDVKDPDEIEDEKIKQDQKAKNIAANRDIFSLLTGLDNSVIMNTNLKEMNNCLELMNRFLNTRVEKQFSENEDEKHHFSFKGKTYFFPKAKMTETTFGDYIESEQIAANAKEIEGGRFGIIAKQMAILCKEEGEEETNDKLVAKKARIFENLPMDIVWNFVFFLMKQTNTYQKSIQMSSKMVKEASQTDMQTNTGTS